MARRARVGDALVVRVKICGIRSVSEARLAERLGADALGVLVGRVHASADFIAPAEADRIARSVPPFVSPVLVTHMEEVQELLRLSEIVSCPVVQLHSDLAGSTLGELRRRLAPRKIVGKVSVDDETALERAREIAPFVDAIVLDSRDRATGRVGGTGHVHDWSISARIVAASSVPIILAGGLTPENVAEAIRVVRPWGVDVNSGVEAGDGRKDEDRMRRFIAAAGSHVTRAESSAKSSAESSKKSSSESS
jgi:phosphoribosylanthranilate isomerase